MNPIPSHQIRSWNQSLPITPSWIRPAVEALELGWFHSYWSTGSLSWKWWCISEGVLEWMIENRIARQLISSSHRSQWLEIHLFNTDSVPLNKKAFTYVDMKRLSLVWWRCFGLIIETASIVERIFEHRSSEEGWRLWLANRVEESVWKGGSWSIRGG